MTSSLPPSPSELLSMGWDKTVQAWQTRLGVSADEAVRALCATTLTVERAGALVQLTPPALFALESAQPSGQLPTKPELFSKVFYAMARAWSSTYSTARVENGELWHPDEGLAVDVSTLGALWLAGHVHHASETFKSTRKIYRYSTSWVDRMLGEMLVPLGLMDQVTHNQLLESAGPLVVTWKPGASAWLSSSVWGAGIFEGYRRQCKSSNGWTSSRRQAWTEAFLSVVRHGVVHVPSGSTVHQKQALMSDVVDLWSPHGPALPMNVQLNRMLDVMAHLKDNPVKWNHPAVRRLLDQCWDAGVTVPVVSNHAERMAAIAQQEPAIHAELRAHTAPASLPAAPSHRRVRV